MTEPNAAWLAPCGLYCGVCAVRMAHESGNAKFKSKLASVYGLPADEIHCAGCLAANAADIFPYCRVCPIKLCTRDRGLDGCHQCDDFPCAHIEQFPMPVGKKVILRAVPQRREWGDAKWAEQEERRYHCPECGYAQFRGAKRCRTCRTPIDLD